MTIIAYKDGILAADDAFVQEDMMWGTAEKIWKRNDGTLIGAHGEAGWCEKFKDWVLGGEEGDAPEAEKDGPGYSCGLIVRNDGRVEIHAPTGVLPFSGEYYAMGSGSALALGAMASGKSAAEAVGVAIQHCCWCGGGTTVLTHEASNG